MNYDTMPMNEWTEAQKSLSSADILKRYEVKKLETEGLYEELRQKDLALSRQTLRLAELDEKVKAFDALREEANRRHLRLLSLTQMLSAGMAREAAIGFSWEI